ncbi:uncharacterized protein N7446_010660 [Penicillium canescens]|uniref:HAT C-terminal dimerisation domain-containing protein n=1 Tax=Penicillium canescens TaxID=5083 RepID=A0AAD6IBD6_PENCN|nr:uncharacterized protein N7446_010660 [Penicillium canescens]KAJ6041452.1 hypothetical protein N7460_006842 [Penicillium canescens]KAJ6041464.1 hypothetical protein N7460_006854 [Penicillium canescens]KAJ6050551.1 hypothetical protein N7446_010660 [Penicillium canescens]KAJ6064844.1 hypothetical protein N7444_000497 [Penicillium canescens]KAJ6065774.1 hypothetical protein N7444_001427 [Penicillium canescens]
MRDLIYALSPTYQIPSRHRIADDLLDEAYHGLQQEVLKELRRTQFLNVTVDETTNIRSQRVIVMTITTPTKSWFIHLNDMEDKTLDAPAISSWILNRLQGILLQLDKVVDWNRINSISTDTCHVMKSVWEKLEATPELRHCFMIPCDSHGLQLIMKDIVDPKSSKVPRAKEVFRSALEVVVFFHHSPLEYARMQAKQIEKWGHRKALIASVITRWGTQYNMLSSLHDCQEAICKWTLATPAASTTRGREIVRTANSHSFWWQLKELIKILKPLHIAQKESEARNSSIMEVTQRWLYLHESLRTLASQTSLKDDFLSYLDGIGWQSRITRQLEPIHWVAYHLDPARVPGKVDESSRYHIEGVLRPLQNEDKSSSAWHEFLSFRQKTGAFYNASCWKANCPSLFWLEAADFAPILAPFARRLCNTVANSAAAERAFSQMNLQHTKVRNRLEPHRVEKLLFVQINKRQFRTEQPPKITQEFLLEEEDNEIERVLQRKQVQDHLSEGSVTSDTSSNPASSPTPSPTPGVGSNVVSTLDINPDLNPEPEPESNSEQDPEPTSAPNSAPTSALVSALNSALNSASAKFGASPESSNDIYAKFSSSHTPELDQNQY